MTNYSKFNFKFQLYAKYDVELIKSLLFFLLNLTSGRKSDINLVRLT